MAVAPTYPGVYVEEVPSGVRTIVGVGTSTGLFIGRTKAGPLNTPMLCLSPNDFERIFSNDTSQGDLPRGVNLFYANGGTQAWIMRIANGAQAAAVSLLAEDAATPVLTITATSAGTVGNDLRLAVTYNAQDPEGSFNLEVFRWTTNARGQLVKTGREFYSNLSMDPNSGLYAPLVVNAASALIQLTSTAPALAGNGTSRSGRALPNAGVPAFHNGIQNLLGTLARTNTLRISVDRNPYVDVDLSGIVVAGLADDTALATAIQTLIIAALSGGSSVTVTAIAGPTGVGDFAQTYYLEITSANGDVRIIPASAKDLAVPLLFGAALGGLELPRSSKNRPAPTGIVYRPTDANLIAFGSLTQNAFDTITVNTRAIALGTSLVTVTPAAPMFQDAISGSVTGHSDGIREKFGIIAAAINQAAASDPTFAWSAGVVGTRLVLTPLAGSDDRVGSVSTGAAPFDNAFKGNVRYYNLGRTATGPFQTPNTTASDGTAPQPTDYANAYPIIDRAVDLFNLMILPRDVDATDVSALTLNGPASVFCQKRRALLMIDAPVAWTDAQHAIDPISGVNAVRTGVVKDTAALFFPRLQIVEGAGNVYVGASGALAGIMARIDTTRGVWKAPAGTEADVRGIVGIEHRLSDDENGVLNPRAINVVRVFPDGIVNWGARTMDGDDDFGSEYKYIPVRRLAYFLEESLVRGLKWVVFEPNAEPLWAQIRLNVGSFMQEQFRKGAFAGTTPTTAYFVKCDKDTTTQADQDLGIVNILVGFAPLRPAEFVVIQLQQMAGQLAT